MLIWLTLQKCDVTNYSSIMNRKNHTSYEYWYTTNITFLIINQTRAKIIEIVLNLIFISQAFKRIPIALINASVAFRARLTRLHRISLALRGEQR